MMVYEIAGEPLAGARIRPAERERLLAGEREARRQAEEAIRFRDDFTALPLDTPLSAEVRGRDPRGGLPKTVVVTDGEIREALSAPLRSVVSAVRAALDRTPPSCGPT